MSQIEEFIQSHECDGFEFAEKLRLAFVHDYSYDRIRNLRLVEYYCAGRKTTFCYRIERELGDLASMGGMFPDGYGVYIDAYNQRKMYRGLKKIFDDDYNSAFEYEKKEILNLLKAGEIKDYKAIRDSKIRQEFKYKLLMVYFPDDFFPVCTLNKAKEYCECFGIDYDSKEDIMGLNLLLTHWKEDNLPKEWPLYNAMKYGCWLLNHQKKYDADDRYEKVAHEIDKEIESLHLVGEMREAVVKQRVNQGVFRDRLLGEQTHCKLCQVNDKRVLVASHIKPWSESLPEEKLDKDNGFLMCPNHDRAFDKGLISFDNDGKIIVSSELTEINKTFLNIRDNMNIELTDGNRKYLDFHRKNVFKS